MACSGIASPTRGWRLDPPTSDAGTGRSTSTANSWLACALGQSACRQGHTVQYVRVPRLLGQALVHARADARMAR
ncbi:ATP-binding protein [Gemmatimonas sp.]|uniref:ATP-binding protein n=1 Tax=Gemmatimonas sp. TaxID=1962908 RepID=UPI00356A112E